MEKHSLHYEFVPYEESLALKELGFDEPCFKKYIAGCLWNSPTTSEIYENIHSNSSDCLAPLYQQAFRWLYQKLDIEKGIMPLDAESQQLLLKELIDKASSKHLLV